MSGIKKNKVMLSCLMVIIFLSKFSIINAAETNTEIHPKQVGKALLTRASVTSKRASGIIVLKRRSAIFEKDEIRVGENGRAQFRMIDQALISVQENSVLKIQNYKYKKGGKNNSVLIELLTGGLRTITGAVGKGNKEAYKLRTPLATIGIRGTDYEVELVPSGMYVAVWNGEISLQSRLKNNCNMLVGRSQPYMFVFIDRLGKCKGLSQVPIIFTKGHSSDVASIASQKQNNIIAAAVATQKQNNVTSNTLHSEPLVIQPLLQSVPPLENLFKYSAYNINQNNPTEEVQATSTTFDSSKPIFNVGLGIIDSANGVVVNNFKQSVGGYDVSWGYWGATSQLPRGMTWATYRPTNFDQNVTRTGSFSYGNVVDSLLSSSAGTGNTLQVNMDVNFDSATVTNGRLQVDNAAETWVAVFDGEVKEGDLNLHLNGASVISSTVKDAQGFITGDFIGKNADAIVGAFGLREVDNKANHVEGVFIVK